METYGRILLYAMPTFFAMVLLERMYSKSRGEEKVPVMDMIASMSSGLTNVTKDVLGLTIKIVTYQWLVEHIALTSTKTTWFTYVIVLLVFDFKGYWQHRIAHTVNIFWNKHAIHHSSEEFNLACALRQSISSIVNVFVFLLIPAALLGIDPKVIATVAPLHLFAQFWYHTQYIKKMGFLEHIIVTPSHHRVHHAVNAVYMDKNFSEIFIFWDKMFGTFQPELESEPPVYGISRQAMTWNPIKINFQHMILLIKDALRAESWKDKFRIWFMPTGWRPADVEARFPVAKIEDAATMVKYQTQNSEVMQRWIYFQFIFTVLLIFYFFANLSNIGMPNVFAYGAFIFLTVYSYTELMDMNPNALHWELLKICYGLACIFYLNSWFGIDNLIPNATYIVLAYFALSLAMTVYFVKKEMIKVLA